MCTLFFFCPSSLLPSSLSPRSLSLPFSSAFLSLFLSTTLFPLNLISHTLIKQSTHHHTLLSTLSLGSSVAHHSPFQSNVPQDCTSSQKTNLLSLSPIQTSFLHIQTRLAAFSFVTHILTVLVIFVITFISPTRNRCRPVPQSPTIHRSFDNCTSRNRKRTRLVESTH